jgi:hypothetical protein
VRQIVHLKLSAVFPAEVREAAILREEHGLCCALIQIHASGGVRELRVPFASCGDLDPARAEPADGELESLFARPAYQRLLDALRRLSRSME